MPALALLLLCLAGCQTIQRLTPFAGTSGQAPAVAASDRIIREVCETFVPITYSKDDTYETQLQIKEHNRRWVVLCQTT